TPTAMPVHGCMSANTASTPPLLISGTTAAAAATNAANPDNAAPAESTPNTSHAATTHGDAREATHASAPSPTANSTGWARCRCVPSESLLWSVRVIRYTAAENFCTTHDITLVTGPSSRDAVAPPQSRSGKIEYPATTTANGIASTSVVRPSTGARAS